MAGEDVDDRVVPKREQMEISRMPERKPQVDTVVPSHRENESMISMQVACTAEQMVAKEIPTLVAGSLNDILQSAWEKAHTRVFSVVYNVFE